MTTMTGTSTDRIEKQLRLDSPRARVWRALTDAKEFGSWFGAQMHGAFTPGAPTRGTITMKGTEYPLEFVVEKMEPERLFSFRWHPFAIDLQADYSKEPMTLVTFTLEPADGGTLLTVVETGFDAIPASRRAMAFEMNTKGWTAQIENIRRYLAGAG